MAKDRPSSVARPIQSLRVLSMAILPALRRPDSVAGPTRAALTASSRQHSLRERPEALRVEDFDLPTTNADDAFILEPAKDATDRLRGEAQVVRDVGARHRQLEARAREPARR